ncbi:NAD(P)-binding protein [Basidiobolus meristosporus CBS 931.73]|uniref:NAD(P)-binding protein n=1 Tax=Basidiobolus meristosporus CBS 931.73 TaxID=1314790 RepID=A0A1Y1X354_9FUNG|nr:NAD(P)-binding protein [Basidiobolus meristosporus CBS 931.73]|eukprot:ORX80095.1 NAD(P)-binding protein [Basidiobolus meristosporus CBS 931.73]
MPNSGLNPRVPVSICIIGGGNRGAVYANFALKNPNLMRIAAVASPTEFRRFNLAKLANQSKVADAVIITNLDSLQYECALAFLEKGYHVLLENPTTLDLAGCRRAVDTAILNNLLFYIGHPRRYSAYNKTIKRLIDSGAIGEVMSIQHLEPVGIYHFQPSFTRSGTKRKSSSLSLLAKNLHDIDLITWFIGTQCRLQNQRKAFNFLIQGRFSWVTLTLDYDTNISVFSRCRQCPHERECCNSAKQMYLSSPNAFEASSEAAPAFINEIENLPDVFNTTVSTDDSVSSQIISMEFDGGKTCNFTMVSCTESSCEYKTRIFGTLGELEADGQAIRLFNFLTRRIEIIRPERDEDHGEVSVHDGDNSGVIRSFLEYIVYYESNGLYSCESENALDIHLCVFAAEEARKHGTVINIDDFRQQFGDDTQSMDISDQE